MLRYTGHPLVDVGMATIAAFAEKRHPTSLTENDLQTVAEYMTREYVKQPLKSFLTVAFTASVWFSQPAYDPEPSTGKLSKKEKDTRLTERNRLADAHLWQWTKQSVRDPLAKCIFTGLPAITVALSGKLPNGRAARCQIPLLQGDDRVNFFAEGDVGLPISGEALLCLQAFPLGAAKCGGRLLAVHSDNDEVTFHFARTFLEENRRGIQLAQQEGSSKMPETRLSMKTLMIETLLKADRMQGDALKDEQPFSVTAYHLSNSGQDPSLDIYQLPLPLIGFLRTMMSADYRHEWEAIVARAWETAPSKKRKQAEREPFEPRRNWLYEDLFGLFKAPDNPLAFIRTYFLRVALRWARADQGDPRGGYSLKAETNLISWNITAQFLRRIMHMDKERIEQVRQMGDKLAEYVSGQNDRRFFTAFFTEQRYDFFRNALIKANLAHVKRGSEPFITLDPYINVFEEGDDMARPDWRLARDLVLIRMVEQLHKAGWLGQNKDAIPEDTQENQSS